jgi:hypothetical protein
VLIVFGVWRSWGLDAYGKFGDFRESSFEMLWGIVTRVCYTIVKLQFLPSLSRRFVLVYKRKEPMEEDSQSQSYTSKADLQGFPDKGRSTG